MTLVDLIGKSGSIKQIKDQLKKVSQFPYPIFLSGETGSGKEVAARYIHQCSDRCNKPFVSVDCAAIPAELLPNEIFGHDRGAYTNATIIKKGKIEVANGGYIFFDEFKKMCGNHNTLLGFLGDGYFSRLGGTKERQSDVRIIAADSLDTELPDDLHDRFTYHIKIPPLRERREDIVLLANHFSKKIAKETGLDCIGFSESEKNILTNYDWPRNIRQLEQTIRRRYINDGGLDFAEKGSGAVEKEEISNNKIPSILYDLVKQQGVGGLDFVMEDTERDIINQALNEGGDMTDVSELLGISCRSLRYRIDKLQISPHSRK